MLTTRQMLLLLNKVAREVPGFQYGPMPARLIACIASIAAAMELYDPGSGEDFDQYFRSSVDKITGSESYRRLYEFYSFPEWHRITESGTQVMEIGEYFHTEECKPVIAVCTYPDELVSNPSLSRKLIKAGENMTLDHRLVTELTPLATKLFGSHGRLFVKGGIHYISPLHFLLCPAGAQRLNPKQLAAGFSALLADPELDKRYTEILKETKQMLATKGPKKSSFFARCLGLIQRNSSASVRTTR